ncbi:unnamed protein product [Pedinophyceae sp. YPF-701]|nr:unnamed protein product [Pedinophyceae sp. YPF-701]
MAIVHTVDPAQSDPGAAPRPPVGMWVYLGDVVHAGLGTSTTLPTTWQAVVDEFGDFPPIEVTVDGGEPWVIERGAYVRVRFVLRDGFLLDHWCIVVGAVEDVSLPGGFRILVARILASRDLKRLTGGLVDLDRMPREVRGATTSAGMIREQVGIPLSAILDVRGPLANGMAPCGTADKGDLHPVSADVDLVTGVKRRIVDDVEHPVPRVQYYEREDEADQAGDWDAAVMAARGSRRMRPATRPRGATLAPTSTELART